MDGKRYFNISMVPYTTEAKNEFDAATNFFNIQENMGLLLVQEMHGSEKIGPLTNVRTIFTKHDDENQGIVDRLNSEYQKYLPDTNHTHHECCGCELTEQGKQEKALLEKILGDSKK